VLPGDAQLALNRVYLGIAAASALLLALVIAVSCAQSGGDTPASADAGPTPTPTATLPAGPERLPSYTVEDLGVSIAYARVDQSGTGTLVIETPDGKSHDVASAKGVFTGIEWSPDGQHLAVSFGPGLAQQDIYVLNADGTGQVQVTKDGHSRRPTWSPDGHTIAFSSGTAVQGQGPVFTIALDSPAATALTQDARHDNPSWSPDGSVIAVSREPGTLVLVSPANGAETRQFDLLRDSAPTYSSFSWSPDGTAIAGVVRRGDSLAMVVLSDSLTSQRQVGGAFLGNPPDPAAAHPCWVLGGTFLISASADTGDILLTDLKATPADMPSTADYAAVQVLIQAPAGTKLAFPAVAPGSSASPAPPQV
jgi:hypothetical protein